MKGLPVFVRRHMLISALLLSALLHFLLLLPLSRQPQPVTRVINADIRVENPRTATLSPPAPQANDSMASATEQKTLDTGQPAPALNADARLKEVATKPSRPAAVESRKNTATEKTVEGDAAKQPGADSTGEKPGTDSTAQQTGTDSTAGKPGTDSTAQQTGPDSTAEKPGLRDTQDELSEDPVERAYQQQILAHLREKVQAPASLDGSVRLSLTLRYKSIATDVQVIRSSGNPQLDDWAVKAAIAANPYPSVPDGFAEPYIFRPTLRTAP